MNIYKTDIDPEDNRILFYEKINIETVHTETTIPIHFINRYLIDFGAFELCGYFYINVDYKERNYMVEKLLKLIRDASITKILS